MKSKNQSIKIEKPLETDKKHIITKLFLISNKNNKHFCFEKTLGIDQTIENGKQHGKKMKIKLQIYLRITMNI